MARSSNSDANIDPPQFGRFYLREMLNRGGMSEIWLVADNRNRPYALRRLKRELRFNFSARRRFMRGCEILSKLTDSDHIVDYVEHGKAEGTCYLVMSYVEADNLKLLQARQDPLLAEHLAQILIDAATGLSDVHAGGYMHLDFKPENILVTRNGAVRLIDFDMAQPIPEKPVKFSKNPGTPGYMAPEQLKRANPWMRARTSHAFGVMAYELVSKPKSRFPAIRRRKFWPARCSLGVPSRPANTTRACRRPSSCCNPKMPGARPGAPLRNRRHAAARFADCALRLK